MGKFNGAIPLLASTVQETILVGENVEGYLANYKKKEYVFAQNTKILKISTSKFQMSFNTLLCFASQNLLSQLRREKKNDASLFFLVFLFIPFIRICSG